MGLSLTHIILLLVVVLVIFGVGKLPQVMGDLGKGIRNFKSGLNEKPDEHKLEEHKPDDKNPPLPPPTE
ncbi:MAG: twin-arginine translocase TatA/TatE family subunit [Alphaproteobacteria bacterium]